MACVAQASTAQRLKRTRYMLPDHMEIDQEPQIDGSVTHAQASANGGMDSDQEDTEPLSTDGVEFPEFFSQRPDKVGINEELSRSELYSNTPNIPVTPLSPNGGSDNDQTPAWSDFGARNQAFALKLRRVPREFEGAQPVALHPSRHTHHQAQVKRQLSAAVSASPIPPTSAEQSHRGDTDDEADSLFGDDEAISGAAPQLRKGLSLGVASNTSGYSFMPSSGATVSPSEGSDDFDVTVAWSDFNYRNVRNQGDGRATERRTSAEQASSITMRHSQCISTDRSDGNRHRASRHSASQMRLAVDEGMQHDNSNLLMRRECAISSNTSKTYSYMPRMMHQSSLSPSQGSDSSQMAPWSPIYNERQLSGRKI